MRWALPPCSQKLLRSPRKPTRKISKIPFKVLDAPELQDDFYLNLVDWSSLNVLSVGLGTCVYLWSACTSQVVPLRARGGKPAPRVQGSHRGPPPHRGPQPADRCEGRVLGGGPHTYVSSESQGLQGMKPVLFGVGCFGNKTKCKRGPKKASEPTSGRRPPIWLQRPVACACCTVPWSPERPSPGSVPSVVPVLVCVPSQRAAS